MELCFISYARNNNLDKRLTRFVEALKNQVLQHMPHGTRHEDVAFFDVQAIDTGEKWMKHLADATRHCKVCVCFYSKPYFTSEYCGREVTVFLNRLRAWERLPAAAGQSSRALIPVIWIPEKVPGALREFNDTGPGYPDKYRKEGLHALSMRKAGRDAYNTVLNLLAQRIAQATLSEPALPQGDAIASFDTVPNSFPASAPVRYGLAYAVLADAAQRQRPFADSSETLDALLTQVAAPLGTETTAPRELPVNAQLPDAAEQSAQARELVLLVVSREALDSANNAALIAQLNHKLGVSATVMVLDAPPPPAGGEPGLGGFIQRAGAEACLRAGDAATFGASLGARLLKLRQSLIQADPPARATDAALEATAAAAGIALDARPILVGPGR